ncbi:hypothetical protein VTO42DRAFT_903 [Malbranchea cinnamomea]
MAALESLSVAVHLLPTSGRRCATAEKVDTDLSFELEIQDNIQTLKTLDKRYGRDIHAPLYVPEFAPDHPCFAETNPFIPGNVTRLSDLPGGVCRFIALAPWVSSNCTMELMAMMREETTAAAFFYLPHHHSTDIPPAADSPVWNITEGVTWEFNDDFPIYAIPGPYGLELVRKLAAYSGNLSEVPYGHQLSKSYGPDTQVRVFGLMKYEDSPIRFPRLWIFMLTLLAVLVSTVLAASLVTRVIQRQRRQSLQRRIAGGEVDLEMLGIKDMRVSRHVLDKLPLYTYGQEGYGVAMTLGRDANCAGEESSSSSHRLEAEPAKQHNSTTAPLSGVQHSSSAEHPSGALSYSQPTCPICLDDYISGDSVVRELPCRHIYHPECIDTFLLQNSSLCPMCKTSVLPPGYCPEIVTDSMVRQERIARRMQREREARNATAGSPATFPLPPPSPPLLPRNGRRRTPPSIMLSIHQARRERQQLAAQNRSQSTTPGVSQANPTDTAERREEMRRRAMALLGNRSGSGDAAGPTDPSIWRKFLYRLFPTLQ